MNAVAASGPTALAGVQSSSSSSTTTTSTTSTTTRTGTDSGTGTMAEVSRNSRNSSIEEHAVRRGSVESNSSESKRRTKVSRACDQCRRKKIKCEYREDSQSCTGCNKNNEKCAFERVPLKRGPSKGYTRTSSILQERHNSRKRRASDEYLTLQSGNGHEQQQHPRQPLLAREDVAHPTSNTPVALPPLHYYLPMNNTQQHSLLQSPLPVPQTSAQSSPQRFPPMQQQFWKVPYYEHQFQRRSSLDSVHSEPPAKPGQNEQYTPSTASSSSRGLRPIQDYFLQHDQAPELPDERERSSSIPSLIVRSNPISHSYHQAPPPQYPYSQFAMAFNGSNTHPVTTIISQQQHQNQHQHQHQQHQHQNLSFQHSHSNFRDTVSPGSTPGYSPRLDAQSTGGSISTTTGAPVTAEAVPTGVKTFSGQYKNPSEHSQSNINIVDCDSKLSIKSSDQALTTGNSAATHPPGTVVIYGRIPDVELIDTYYEYMHFNYPILPINKHILTNEILMVNTQPISEVHELNNYVLHWFRASLELLIRISAEKTPADSLSFSLQPNVTAKRDPIMGGTFNSNEVEDKEDPLFVQSIFISALNECFQKIVDVHPKVREYKESISPKVTTIYLSTFIILNYILALVGYDNSFVLGMSVTIFNEFKLFKLLMLHDDTTAPSPSESVNQSKSADGYQHIAEEKNYLGFELLYKRLYYSLVVFDSLQSCCFGVPKLISVPIAHLTESLFRPKVSVKNDKWAIESDEDKLEVIMSNLRLGALITELCETRKLMTSLQSLHHTNKTESNENSVIRNFQTPREFRSAFLDDDTTIAGLFYQFLWSKRQLIDELLSIPLGTVRKPSCEKGVHQEDPEDRHGEQTKQRAVADASKFEHKEICSPPEMTTELCARLTKTICRLTAKAHLLLHLITELNPTNCVIPRAQTPSAHSTVFLLTKGTISPFVIAIYRDLFNVIELTKNIPTSLIGYIMGTGTQDHSTQELVVSLSRCMSNMIQIQSVAHSPRPFKIFNHELHRKTNQSLPSAPFWNMARFYSYDFQPTTPQEVMIQQFIDIAWGLLEDEELGWF